MTWLICLLHQPGSMFCFSCSIVRLFFSLQSEGSQFWGFFFFLVVVVVSSEPQSQRQTHGHTCARPSCLLVNLHVWLRLSQATLGYFSTASFRHLKLICSPGAPPTAPLHMAANWRSSQSEGAPTLTMNSWSNLVWSFQRCISFYLNPLRLNGVHASSGGSDEVIQSVSQAFDEINMQNDEQREETKRMAYREEIGGWSSELEHMVDVKFLLFVRSLEGPSALL